MNVTGQASAEEALAARQAEAELQTTAFQNASAQFTQTGNYGPSDSAFDKVYQQELDNARIAAAAQASLSGPASQALPPPQAFGSLYNASNALIPVPGGASAYSGYDPRFGPAPAPEPYDPGTALVPVSSAYRGGFSGRESAGRGYPADEPPGFDYDPGTAFGADPFRPAPSGDGYSYNERRRRYDSYSTRRPMADDDSNDDPLEASYAHGEALDVKFGGKFDTGWKGNVQETFSRASSAVKEFATGKEAGWAIGFGGAQSLAALSNALAPTVSGEEYLPGQVAEQATTSALPVIGSIAGTILGAKFGGTSGGMGGQFLGQAVGAGAEDLIDTYFNGHTFAQEKAGYSLGAGRGGNDEIAAFTESLRSLTGATKDVTEAFQKMGTTGPVTPGGVQAIAGMQPALGPAFSQTIDSVSRYLESSPFTAGDRVRLGNGNFDSNELFAQSLFAYSHGDFQAGLTLNAAGKARNVNGNEYTGYARDEKINADYQAEPWWQKAVGYQSAAAREARERMGRNQQFPEGFKPTDAAALASEGQDFYERFQADQVSIVTGQATVRRDAGGIQSAQLRGESAAQIARMLPGLNSDLDTQRDAYESGIQIDRDVLKRFPNDPTLRAQTRADIAQIRGEEAALNVQRFGVARSVTLEGVQEADSSFRLGNLEDTLHGVSAARQAPGDTAYFRSLIGKSKSLPFLSPTERDALRSEGETGVYQTQQAVYQENIAGIDLRTAQATAGVERAQRDGGPQDVFGAGQAVVDSYTAKVRELTDELTKGNLTYSDRIQKERELTDTRRQSATYDDARHESLYGDNGRVFGTQRQADSVGLSRRLGRGGNAAFDGSILADDLNAETNAQSHLDYDRKNHPGNLQRIADDTLALRQAQEGRQDDLDAANTFRPTGAASRQLSNDEAAFQRSKIAPYSDAGADPFARGQALERDYRGRLGQLDSNRAGKQRAGSWRDEDESRYTDQRNDLLGHIAELAHDRMQAAYGALPEMIAGSGGRGVGAALISPRALSALTNPNAENGSWAGVTQRMPGGYHAIDPTGLIPLSSPGAGGMGEMTRLLSTLVNEVQRQGRTGGRSALSGPVAPRDHVGPASHALIFGYNPNTGN